ncbi:MAG: hypothetical protein ABF384_04475 [Verrucomicrobiales bacterium]
MKKSTFLLTSLLASALAITACTEQEADHYDHKSSGSTADSSPAGQAEHASGQTVCPVSGEPLGSMGEPITMIHDGKEVKLCCKSCIKKFKADPATYTAKVHGS